LAIPTYTRHRDRVARLAASEPEEALTIARRIEEPWFRCQALAHVAYHCAGLAKKNEILGESFRAALESRAPNRVVSVSAWPLKVLCKSGQNDKLTVEVERLLVIIAGEPSPVRRADALNQVLGAVLSGPRALFWRVFDQFREACLAPLMSGKRNRKGESRLAHWVVVVDRFDPARARQVMEAVNGPTLRQQALRALREHKNTEPESWCAWPYLG